METLPGDTNTTRPVANPRTIAIVSGKGGSGKTIISITMARVLLQSLGMPVVLVDVDPGTAGMTYYLGMEEIKGKRVGLTDYVFSDRSLGEVMRPLASHSSMKFIGMGDHRSMYFEQVNGDATHPEGDVRIAESGLDARAEGARLRPEAEPSIEQRMDDAQPEGAGSRPEAEANIEVQRMDKAQPEGAGPLSEANANVAGRGSDADAEGGRPGAHGSASAAGPHQEANAKEAEPGQEVVAPVANGYARIEKPLKTHHDRSEQVLEKLPHLLEELKRAGNWIILDCRGGLDDNTISVCGLDVVDDIVIIAETDTTSYQATRLLIEVLTAYKLGWKIQGFLINKVFGNVDLAVREAKSFYGVSYLYSIPLDLTLARDFMRGKLPGTKSQFTIHVWEVLHRLYAEVPGPKNGRVWHHWEFHEVGLVDRDSRAGGYLLGFFLALGLMALFARSASLRAYFSGDEDAQKIAAFTVWGLAVAAVGLFGCVEWTRQFIGIALRWFTRGILLLTGYDAKS